MGRRLTGGGEREGIQESTRRGPKLSASDVGERLSHLTLTASPKGMGKSPFTA